MKRVSRCVGVSLGLLSILGFLAPAMSSAAPLGRPGAVAHYALDGAPEDRSKFETENELSVVKAAIQLGPVERVRGGDNLQWYGLHFSRLNGDSYQMWALIDGWPTAESDPNVEQYLWYESTWPDALRYVHEVDGSVILPRLCLWTYGWPQEPETGGGSNRAPVEGMPKQILFQGWPFVRVDMERQPDLAPPENYTTIELNPDLVIGWVYQQYFDIDGQPNYRLESGEYRYRDKTREDMEAHFDSGFNFYASRGKEPWLMYPENLDRRGIYHSNINSRSAFEAWPAQLYRSNYWGVVNHIDEPGVHNFGAYISDKPDRSEPHVQVVESLQRVIQNGWETRGRETINDMLEDNRTPSPGDMWLIEPEDSIVTWEYEWPTAWYQLGHDVGLGAMVDEDAVNDDLVATYNMGFGTEIPPTVENASALRVAVMRGAARNFNKRWGIAIYFPNEVKLKSSSLPYFYEKGASYFWLWLDYPPHPYKRYYATMMREAFLRNPDRDMDALLRAAKVAVVIPYGYTFAPYNMHRNALLHLERQNAYGVSYREVLSNAAMEVERLIRMGIEFDIAVDEPRFHKTGYEELVFAQEDGKIRIERDGETVELRDEPRPFSRPDLGPGPKLTLEVVESDDDKPGRFRFRATAELGTSEWASERPEPLISWEIYNPDGTVSPWLFPEYGEERMLRVEDNVAYTMRHPVPEHLMDASMHQEFVEGSYTVRAATADVFGRPAVAYKTIYMDESVE